ncbi:molybdate ABC transporter substrate-binding protein [Naumannella halotolerans]|uniref:Molybdate transport system substrate-binding protein n=1 Tax=Naumannella halotolerans TaxID=993414 RepID=A0A4R7J2H0_9ACTN|nr:molybdate ABC transporter substrate-binding protein [Naumannella halotolerans]TDT31360.1 molybdate transport system substrate-binding protein [Naumannella halotolerans]
MGFPAPQRLNKVHDRGRAAPARRTPLVAAVVIPVLLLTGCTDDAGPGGDTETTTLTVFAAASLNATFTEIGSQFEAANPGTSVRFDFNGSSTLVQQIVEGAPVDVFASANTATMTTLTEAGMSAGEPIDFATNVLTIAVAPGNPHGVTGLADLQNPELKTVLCAPQVPCGEVAQTVEGAAGVEIEPVSEEQSVTDVVNKIGSGEADAGLVYVTDVIAADGSVEAVDFPESAQAVNRYPITTVDGSPHTDVGRQFVGFVVGPQGQAALAEAGFGQP